RPLCSNDPFASLELDPERKLTDAIPSRVSLASKGGLSEIGVSHTVGGVVPVYVVGCVGKAAFELELESVGKLKGLGEHQREIHRLGANERPHTRVAKAADRRRTRTIELIGVAGVRGECA